MSPRGDRGWGHDRGKKKKKTGGKKECSATMAAGGTGRVAPHPLLLHPIMPDGKRGNGPLTGNRPSPPTQRHPATPTPTTTPTRTRSHSPYLTHPPLTVCSERGSWREGWWGGGVGYRHPPWRAGRQAGMTTPPAAARPLESAANPEPPRPRAPRLARHLATAWRPPPPVWVAWSSPLPTRTPPPRSATVHVEHNLLRVVRSGRPPRRATAIDRHRRRGARRRAERR